MKKTGHWIALIFIVSVLTGSCDLAFAQDDELSRRTLRGLEGIYVIINSLTPEIRRDGLTEDMLRTDTELKLRMAGIKVLSLEEMSIMPNLPCLHVFSQISKYQPPEIRLHGYFHTSSVYFRQNVSLIRAPNIKTSAITWVSKTIYGISPEIQDIRSITKDLVDQFINAYLSVNPK